MYGAGTPIPANAQRLLGLASDLDGDIATSRQSWQSPRQDGDENGANAERSQGSAQNPVLRTVHEKNEFLPDPLTLK